MPDTPAMTVISTTMPFFSTRPAKVVGTADRYNGGTYTGQSAWFYNSASTVEIGLTDAGHTRDDGYQNNFGDLILNEAGQVVGNAERYNGAIGTGQSAWFYDATIDQTYSMDLSVRSTDDYAFLICLNTLEKMVLVSATTNCLIPTVLR